MRDPFLLYRPFSRFALLTTVALGLCACNAFDRLTDVGSSPQLGSIDDPTHAPGYVPVKMPMPPPSLAERQPNSLWQTGARAFFRDQRAGRVGDILTVVVTINDQAQIANETVRSRTNSDALGMTNMFGFERKPRKFLPAAATPASLVDTNSALSNDGKGTIARQEQIDLRVAAEIVQVLPNGNLVLQGTQQIGVNY